MSLTEIIRAMRDPMGTQAVQLNLRMKRLGAQVKAEAMQISAFWQNAMLKEPERANEFNAACDAELDKLFAWERYITSLIASDCSSLGGAGYEQPQSICMPRSRLQYSCDLAGLLDLPIDDPLQPLIQIMVEFFSIYIVMTLSGQVAASSTEVSSAQAALITEMRKRLSPPLKPLPTHTGTGATGGKGYGPRTG